MNKDDLSAKLRGERSRSAAIDLSRLEAILIECEPLAQQASAGADRDDWREQFAALFYATRACLEKRR